MTALGGGWLALAEPLRAAGVQGAATIVTAIVLVLAVLATSLSRSRGDGRTPRFLWAFAMWAVVGVALHHVTRGALQNVAVYLCFASAVTLAVRFPATSLQNELRALRNAALVGVVPSALVSVATAGTDLRAIGTGAFPMIAAIGVLCTVLSSRGRVKAGFCVVFFLAVLASLSRELVTITVLLMTLPSLGDDERRSGGLIRGWVLRLVPVGIASWFALSNYAPLATRFENNDGGSLLGVDVGTSGRLEIWRSVTTAFAHGDKLLGNGPGAAEQVVTNTFFVITQPHDDYLRLLFDLGVVGLALWVVVLLGLIVRGVGLLRSATSWDGVRRGLLVTVGTLFIVATSVLDNTIVYVFAMIPLGVMIGGALYPETSPSGVAPETAVRPTTPMTSSRLGSSSTG